MPRVRAGFESLYRGDARFRRTVFQVLIEERTQNLTTERQRRIAIELYRAERTAVTNLLPVVPWTKHEKHLVVVRIFRLDRFVDGDVAVDIFLIPQTVYEHHGNLERLLREDFVHRLILPVRVVTRMFENLAPEADLFQTTAPPELTCRAGFH